MKLTIDREELLRGLGRIQAIVERRGTLPILANALIRADADGVTLSATDLEVGVLTSHPAEVANKGAVTLGAKKLYEIVRELGDHPVQIAVEAGSRVRIESGQARFSLLSISPEEYPTLPGAEGVTFVELEASLLASMIDSTLYATSTDETRYNLNGVFMELDSEGRLVFVATNGHRLAKIEKAPPRPVAFLQKGIIVPRKGVNEIRKLCEETEDSVEMGLGDGFLLVRRPGQLLSCRLIDGEFPDYHQVIPEGHQIRVLVERERLIHAVRRISLVAHERSGGFRLALDDGQMELHAQNPDLGEATERIPIEYQGDRFETGFNARYMLDALAATTSKELVLDLRDELTPAQIRPADSSDQVSVIMPMRL